jgi:hypothetical protein
MPRGHVVLSDQLEPAFAQVEHRLRSAGQALVEAVGPTAHRVDANPLQARANVLCLPDDRRGRISHVQIHNERASRHQQTLPWSRGQGGYPPEHLDGCLAEESIHISTDGHARQRERFVTARHHDRTALHERRARFRTEGCAPALPIHLPALFRSHPRATSSRSPRAQFMEMFLRLRLRPSRCPRRGAAHDGAPHHRSTCCLRSG